MPQANTPNNLPSLEELLSVISFKSLITHQTGYGWIGTRYSLDTYNWGTSPVYTTLEELKVWIINNVPAANIKYHHLLKPQFEKTNTEPTLPVVHTEEGVKITMLPTFQERVLRHLDTINTTLASIREKQSCLRCTID